MMCYREKSQVRYDILMRSTFFQTNKSDPSHFFQRIISFRTKNIMIPKKFQESHNLWIQQTFCNIHAETPYQSVRCI